MAGRIETRLKEFGISIPDPVPPFVAKIVGYKVAGGLVYVSGQVPKIDGKLAYVGKVGREFTLEEGQMAARTSALCVLGEVKAALGGDLDRMKEIVKIKGYVNCDPDFTDISAVVNGASELFMEIFGEAGKHARTAIGVASMPLGVAIEVEGIFRVE